ncbi:acyl-lipid (9-3)-desaturase-like [Lycium barbarum]|uniref:acyl-lipid (9-3)-desaturase-like n=1 Tax=Lycium barbarum TaxID=112863 RepID=UPI00293E4AA9|nr:acyl-lipid (9-3)-desaturase-like [Lycium barbarum]
MADSRKYITSEELKNHKKPGDLWIAIQGKVYDISNWVKEHPGGDFPLLNLAGQDVTDAFVAYHPATTWQYLDKFFNGFYVENYFASEVSKDYRKLVSEFTKLGLFEKKGHVYLFTMCFMAMLFAMSVYGILCCQTVFAHLISGGLMGFFWIQSGWISHDLGHYQVMRTRRLNRFAQLLTANCLNGINFAWWKWRHNSHHIACNSLEYDPDLQHMPLFVVSSKCFNSLTSYYYNKKMTFDSFTRFLVSYQHWTFYPVMCVARIIMFVESYIFLLSKKNVPHLVQELLGLVSFWIWYPLLVSCLPNWSERIMFVFASSTVPGIQHVQFCLNHFSSKIYIAPLKGNDWIEKQIGGSLDISCPSWMDWFHGGLQFQIEHHLFPRLPRCQLRKVSPFVKDLCNKHGLPYNCASFLNANALTINTLRVAALQARDLTKPVRNNLVWEAVNTHA